MDNAWISCACGIISAFFHSGTKHSSFTGTGMGSIDKYTCSECTSPLWFEEKSDVDTARVFVGAIKNQRWVEDDKPVEELWCNNKCDWLPDMAEKLRNTPPKAERAGSSSDGST
ncbi:hypothetical protein F4775DRAFT_594705 [Biscogniauxia sp. FL1348]|nr:hypothetical protein F4775DRAFT_594705 [Biscogniauxia sp. FL1348]